jgi:VanZ family protein
LVILFWGLRPFNFRPSNGATWLKTENGINFQNYGIVYGPSELKDFEQLPSFAKQEPISIEIWLTPGSDGHDRFSCIFSLYDGKDREIISLSQAKSLLNISKYKKPGKRGLTYNWRWLKNTFFKGQRRFLSITSDKSGTTVYLDGKRVKKYRNYSLMFSKYLAPVGCMIIGNNLSGTKPWTGKIYGLAIYNHALSQKQIVEHFEKWKGNAASSLLKEKDIIALYPMDEQNGQIIHNAVPNNFHLSIPARFKILKKNFLKLSGDALKLNGSSLRDMRINILGFMPLGFLAYLVLNAHQIFSKTASWRLMTLAVVAGAAISLIVEILQAFLPTRNSSLTDLIFNTVGTGLGIILALVFIRLKNRSRRTSFSESQ